MTDMEARFNAMSVSELREHLDDLDDRIEGLQVERREARAALHRKVYGNCAAAQRLRAPRDRRSGKPLRNPPHPALPPERD